MYIVLILYIGSASLEFFYISNSSRQYLNYELDGVSNPIYIPYGFAFGNETFTKAYVSKQFVNYYA